MIAIALMLLTLVPAALLYAFRQRRLARRHQGDPWACGYQYEQKMTVSAASITRPMRHMFGFIYNNRQTSFTERFVLPYLSNGSETPTLDSRKVCRFCIIAVVVVLLFVPLISGVSL